MLPEDNTSRGRSFASSVVFSITSDRIITSFKFCDSVSVKFFTASMIAVLIWKRKAADIGQKFKIEELTFFNSKTLRFTVLSKEKFAFSTNLRYLKIERGQRG